MDLMMPLATICPGLDSAALTVLAGTEAAMSATQVQRIAGRGSRYGLVLALDRLTESGLVTAIPAARGRLYQLNRAHILTPVVIAAVRMGAELEARLVGALRELTPIPISVAIFGSVARHEATTDSDIDLLIVVDEVVDPDSDSWIRQIGDLERLARSWTGNPLQTTTVTRSQLAAMAGAGAAIMDEWEREARTIVGQPADGLIRLARQEARA